MLWFLLAALAFACTTLPLFKRRLPMPLEVERRLPSTTFRRIDTDGNDEGERNGVRLPRFYDRYAVYVEREVAERKQIAGQKIKDRFNLAPTPRRFLVRDTDRLSDIEARLQQINDAAPVAAVFPKHTVVDPDRLKTIQKAILERAVLGESAVVPFTHARTQR